MTGNNSLTFLTDKGLQEYNNFLQNYLVEHFQEKGERTLLSPSTREIEDVPVRPAEPSIEEHTAEASEDSLKFLTSKGLQDYNDILKNWLPTEYVRKDDPSISCEVNMIKGGAPIKMEYVFKYAFHDQDIEFIVDIDGEFRIDGIRVDSFEVKDYPEGWSNFSISPMHEMSDSFEINAEYQGTTYQTIMRGGSIRGELIFADQVIGSYQCSMICGALDSDLDLTKHNIVNVPFLSEDGDISYSFSEFQAFESLQGSVISSTLTDIVFQSHFESTGIKAILFAGEGEIIEQETGMEKAYVIMFSYDEEQPSEDTSYMKSITYDDLKSLRDNGQLVPGMQYRITDYECTTAMSSTQSANHQFDIIVTADSESVLNENARTINHLGEPTQVPGFNMRMQIDNDVKIRYSDGGTYYGIVTGNEKELYGTTYYRVDLNTSGIKDFTLASEETQPSVVYINNGYEMLPGYNVDSITRNLLYMSYENNSGSSIQFILNGTETFDGTTYYKFTNNEQLVLKQLRGFDKITGEPSYASNSAEPGNFALYALSDTPSDFNEIYISNEDHIIRLIDLLNAEFRSGFFTITTECTPTTIEVPYDDYFKDSNLKSWEIKYSLDNDTNRFDWALDGIQPSPSLTAFLFWEDDEGQEYVYTHYEVNAEYIEWWEEVLDSAEEVELDLGPRRGVRASGPHVFTGVKSEYDSGVYGASDLKNKVGKIKEMKVEEQPTKTFLTWWYYSDEGKQQYVTFYECKIDAKAGLIHWFNGDSPIYKECYTYAKLAVWSGKDYPETLVYDDKSFKTSIGYISQYSLPNAKKGTLDWKDGDTDRTYNSYYVYNNEANKQVVAWTGEDISDKQEGDYGQNTVYTYCPPSDYSETDPQGSGYVYSSDSLDDRTLLRGPADIGTISDFNMPIIPAEETRGVVLRETAESEPTYITGKGLIYYMKDEYGNEAPYDFKNIQYVIGEKVFYTFNVWVDELQSYNDDSTVGYGTCYGNVIKTYKSVKNKQALNFIIHGSGCTLNTFECNCHSNNIGDFCHSNTFKENCSKNSMSQKCSFNTFEKGFEANTIYTGTTSVHAFEYVINCNIGGKYIQIYPYTHDIDYKEYSDYPKFVGNPVEGGMQIAEYWPYRIKYKTRGESDSEPIIYPENAINYLCHNLLMGLTIDYDSSNNMNFKVEFTAGADFTITLPSNSRYIGSLDCESGKTYLLVHDDEGMYYIGELNTSI